MFRKLFFFVKRDYLEDSSYKFAFVFSILGILFSSSTFFFISKLIPSKDLPMLAPYGGDYFSFVIVGLAFSSLLSVFEKTIPGIIVHAQTTGTLESLFTTRSSIPMILLGLSLYPFLWTLFEVACYLFFGVVLFGAKFGVVNWFACFIIMLLGSLGFLSIGILSASFLLIFKKGSPFSWIFGSISGLMGGVFFPISILPVWLRWVAYILPITHTLEGARKSLLTSATLSEVLPSIMSLSIFAIILLPTSLFLFNKAVQTAKRYGILAQY